MFDFRTLSNVVISTSTEVREPPAPDAPAVPTPPSVMYDTPPTPAETPRKQLAKRQKLEESLVANISQLTTFITQHQSQQTPPTDDADKFGSMVCMQYRNLNAEQRQFFNVKVQQAYLEALQYNSNTMVNTESTWRL